MNRSHLRVSRRRVIQGMGASALGLAGASLIGCSDSEEADEATVVSGGSATATSTSTQVSGSVKTGGHLSMRKENNLISGDPHRQTSNRDVTVGRLYAAALLKRGVDGSVSPYLVESYEFNEGREVILKLRQDIPFADGTLMTSEDVAYTFDRGKNNEIAEAVHANHVQIDTVEAPDDHTVVLRLAAPNAAFIEQLGDVSGVVLPKKVVESLGDDRFGETPMGAGPFKIEEMVADSQYTFVRNEKWPFQAEGGGLPYLDGVRVAIIPDTSVAIAALSNGELDIDNVVEVLDMPSLEGINGIEIQRVEGARYGAIEIAVATAPADDLRFRQALNYAMDRDEALQVMALGVGSSEVRGGLTELSWGYDSSLPFYAYKPEEAAKLLSAMGITDGFEVVCATYTPAQAEMVQAQLARVGLKIVIESLDVPTFQQRFRDEGAYPIGTSTGSAIVGDPDPFFRQKYHSTGRRNPGGVPNPDFDKLIDEAAARFTVEERKPLYAELTKMDYDRAYNVWTWTEPRIMAQRARVKNAFFTSAFVDISAAWLDA